MDGCPEKCGLCGTTDGHLFECRNRPKGTAPVEELDWRLIEALIAAYTKQAVAGVTAFAGVTVEERAN